jgi:hypothetical protein
MSFTVQNTYLTDYVAGFPGMLADGTTQNRLTGLVQDAAGIGFGLATFQAASPDKGITATPGTKFKGITIENQTIVPPVGGAPDVYAQYSSASLLDNGNIWITAAVAVTPGQQVYVTSAGAFTNVSTGNTAIPATFIDTAAAGASCRIRVVQQ